MTTKTNYGNAIVSVDILDINAVEMRQMCELEQRIAEVLYSHINKVDADGNPIKAQYLSDDELRMMRAILFTFTRDYKSSTSSMFDDVLKELKAQEPKPKKDSQPDDNPSNGSTAI